MKKYIFLVIISVLTAGGSVSAQSPADEAGNTEKISKVQYDESGNVIVPPASDKAMSYYNSGNVVWILGTVQGLLLPLLLLFTGISARMRNLARKIGKKWFFTIVIYYAIFSITMFFLEFPLDYYAGFIRPHDYGLSNQSFFRWGGNNLKSLGLDILGGAVFLWIPYLLLKRSPRRWYLYSGLLSIPFAFLMLIITPIWISPLFNNYGPMQDKNLEMKIQELAARAGIEGSRIFEVDKSQDTKTVNAYVTGFMGSSRIVLWDTIIERLDEDELLFVMGHEMGHYVLAHQIESVFFISILIIASLYFANKVSFSIIHKYSGHFGFSELADIASLPLILFLMTLFSLIVDPITNSYSRYKEKEADRFGLEITKDNKAAASAFIKLQSENLANPYPGVLYIMWRSSHPPIGKRVEFINNYRPWETGEELIYGHYFMDKTKRDNKYFSN